VGTFRLSIVVALVALLGSAVYAHFIALDGEQQDMKTWRTLQCAQKFLNQDMSAYTNQLGLIDIGRAGCSFDPFYSTFGEIRRAADIPRTEGKYGEYFQRMLSILMLPVLGVFVLVNALGLVFLAARGALRWVWAGYR
jgi:hypothetical protein